jgi:hypothetical protein
MSLIKYGIAVAVGYHFGQPQGRKQLEQLRRHVVQLGKRPEVKQWQERGWDIAYERALAAKRLASTTTAGRKKTVDPATTSATSVADDTERRSRLSTSPTLADPTSDRPARSRGHRGYLDRVRWSDSGGGLRGRHHRVGPPPPMGRTTPPSPAPRP